MYINAYTSVGVLDQNNFFNNILLDLSDSIGEKFKDFFIEDQYIYLFIEEKQKRNSQTNRQINLYINNINNIDKDKFASITFNFPMGKLNSYAIYLLQYNN